MKTNIGSIDRIIRYVIGFALLGAGLVLHSWWGLVGLLPVLTATLRFCPAYLPFGLNTGASKSGGSCCCCGGGGESCDKPKK